MLDALAAFFAPWAKYYADHTWLSNGVTFVHVGSLLWGGGRAITADLVTLRAANLRGFIDDGHLKLLRTSHRDVVGGLAVATISGVLMFFADFNHYLTTVSYWVKMGGVVILLVNGWLLTKAESQLDLGGPVAETAFRRGRRFALVSIGLWFATTLLGQMVTTA